jgi:hypothetical protein
MSIDAEIRRLTRALEAADARAAKLEAERDEARRVMNQAKHDQRCPKCGYEGQEEHKPE